MATDVGNFQKTKNIIWPLIWKRDAKRVALKESMIDLFSWTDDWTQSRWSFAWDNFAEQDHTYRMSEAEHFHCKQNWSVALNMSGNDIYLMRKRSDFNQTLSTLNQRMETGIVFYLFLVAMEWILVDFSRIQSQEKRRQVNVCDRKEQPVVYRTLAKTLDKWPQEFILFCYR